MFKPRGTAVITGAASNIGAAYADRLARQGYDLILIARDRDLLQQAAASLTDQTGRSVEVMAADLALPADLLRVETSLRLDASITLLLNHSDGHSAAEPAGPENDNVAGLIALGVIAPTRLAYALAPGFVARGTGIIINVASVTALAPGAFTALHGASSAFVLSFSRALQQQLRRNGVRIQAVLLEATASGLPHLAGHLERSARDIARTSLAVVDAALAGLAQGDLVSIPYLADLSAWDTFEAASSARAATLSGLDNEPPPSPPRTYLRH